MCAKFQINDNQQSQTQELDQSKLQINHSDWFCEAYHSINCNDMTQNNDAFMIQTSQLLSLQEELERLSKTVFNVFCVLQKSVSHIVMERHKGEQIISKLKKNNNNFPFKEQLYFYLIRPEILLLV